MKQRVLADTSVLVAAFVESHPSHTRALPWLQKARGGDIDLLVCGHTLAELYAVLTRLPLSPRIRPALARRLVRDNVESIADIVDLEAADYATVLDGLAELEQTGGVVYDALIARAARKADAATLLTLNEKDFRRVWPEGAVRILSP